MLILSQNRSNITVNIMNNCLLSQIMMFDNRVDDVSMTDLDYEDMLCKCKGTF